VALAEGGLRSEVRDYGRIANTSDMPTASTNNSREPSNRDGELRNFALSSWRPKANSPRNMTRLLTCAPGALRSETWPSAPYRAARSELSESAVTSVSPIREN
jgi:hypothetical protein